MRERERERIRERERERERADMIGYEIFIKVCCEWIDLFSCK